MTMTTSKQPAGEKLELPTHQSELFKEPGHWQSDHVLRILAYVYMGTPIYKCFGIGGWNEHVKARKVVEGALESGPYAYAFELAGFLDNAGGSQALSEARQAAGTEHLVEDGQIISLDGNDYRVTVINKEAINLELV